MWIVDAAPPGGDTAYTNTWALGRLAPGQTRRFVWRVTAVQAGTRTVKWAVAAGLNGKAKATLAGNRAPAGSVTVDVSDKPAQAGVDPETGEGRAQELFDQQFAELLIRGKGVPGLGDGSRGRGVPAYFACVREHLPGGAHYLPR